MRLVSRYLQIDTGPRRFAARHAPENFFKKYAQSPYGRTHVARSCMRTLTLGHDSESRCMCLWARAHTHLHAQKGGGGEQNEKTQSYKHTSKNETHALGHAARTLVHAVARMHATCTEGDAATGDKSAERDAVEGHNYIGHNYIGHDTVGHNYIGHNYMFRQETSPPSARPSKRRRVGHRAPASDAAGLLFFVIFILLRQVGPASGIADGVSAARIDVAGKLEMPASAPRAFQRCRGTWLIACIAPRVCAAESSSFFFHGELLQPATL